MWCNVRSEQHDRMMRCVQNCLSAVVTDVIRFLTSQVLFLFPQQLALAFVV